MNFRVFLDSTQYTGIVTTELPIEYIRAPQERGFMTKFSESVTFLKDAYDYLIGLFNTNPCATVDVLIEVQCAEGSLWETYIEGILKIGEIEVNEDECSIEAPVRQNNIDALFNEYKNFKVDFNSTQTLNGESLSTVRTELHDFPDGVGGIIAATLVNFAKGYRIDRAFDYILRYITDNRLTFVSDFMDTAIQQLSDVWQLDFSANPVVGEVITITILDQFNNTIIYEITSDGNATNFLGFISAAIANTHNSANGPRLSFSDNTNLGTAPPSIQLFSYEASPRILSVTSTGATTATITHPTVFQENLSNYYISNGYLLTNRFLTSGTVDYKPFELSFADLFRVVLSMRDMSYAIEPNGSDYVLRMEPIEYFLSGQVQAEISNASGIITTNVKDRQASSISVGTRYNSNFEAYTFNTLDCGETMDFTFQDVYFDTINIIGQINLTDDKEESLFLIKGNGDSAALDTVAPYTNFGAFPQIYNVGLLREFLLLNHLAFAPDYVNVGSYTEIQQQPGGGGPTTAKAIQYIGAGLQFLKEAKFSYPIGYTTFTNISPYGLIPFTNKNGTRYGYITNLKYNPHDLSEFNLLVQ